MIMSELFFGYLSVRVIRIGAVLRAWSYAAFANRTNLSVLRKPWIDALAVVG